MNTKNVSWKQRDRELTARAEAIRFKEPSFISKISTIRKDPVTQQQFVESTKGQTYRRAKGD